MKPIACQNGTSNFNHSVIKLKKLTIIKTSTIIFPEEDFVWLSCTLCALVPVGTPLIACTASASRSVRKEVIDILKMAGCVQGTTSPGLRPTVRLGLSSDTVLDGLPIVTPKCSYYIN